MATIGIFYGSSSDNTKGVAEKIQSALGTDTATLCDIGEASAEELNKYPYLILGTSTWGIGDLQDDWDRAISNLDDIDFSNKKVALFGTGDQEGYADSFVDAVGILYEKLAEKDATVIGSWPTEGYTYDASKAEKDGQFVGLVIDEDNQSDLTDERVTLWVDGLKKEFN